MPPSNPCEHPVKRLPTVLLAVAVLLVALCFRTYHLDRVPPGLDGDEMFNGWDALRVWEGNLAVYFAANYGREPLLIYLIAIAVRLFGVSAWALRIASVACGLVGLACTWSLARRLFNVRVAVLTTGLMAVSLWPTMLNRVALRVGLLPACQAAAVYALWRALDDARRQRPGSKRWAAAAGLLTGLTLYTYTSSRVFPFVLGFWLLALPFLDRRLVRGNGKRLLLAGLVAVLVALPLGLFALRHPETFNQRVDVLSVELSQLLAGNPEPFWRSVKATLGMFTHRGDWEWRYNPAGRPVFDPLTGAFFYLGLVVSLCRLRRPQYALLLIWMPFMLLPSVLSIGTPSFWRSAGALTPIYLMPAIGLDFVWAWVARWAARADRWRRVTQRGFLLIAVAGLALVGADTWHDYFDVWAYDRHVMHTYEADLAAAARFLNAYTPVDTPVWVSSEYPADLSRRILKLQSDYPGPVRWFDGNELTVWPASQAGRDVLVLFTESSPPGPDALAAFGDYEVFQETHPAGRPYLWVYRIPGEALADVPWRPAQARSGRFAYNREIVGYDVPARAERQGIAPVIVYWRVPPGVEMDFEDIPHSFVCIQDSVVGRCLDDGSSHHLAYPMWDWSEGDVVAERYDVPVPAFLQPQTTYFHIGLFNSRGELSFADEEIAGAPLLGGPVEIVGTASQDPKWEADTPTFDGDLALLGYGVLEQLSPGSTLEVGLEWQAMRAPAVDYAVRLELRDPAGGDVVLSTEEVLGAGRHPTSRWVSGEPVHTFHRMQIPPGAESGDFDVALVLWDSSGGEALTPTLSLGTLSISGRPHYFDLPAPEYPLTADFGPALRLLGYDLDLAAPTPGGEIQITLYWQALDTVGEDYKVFVHLYHPTIPGGLPGQHDSPPGNGAFPTSGWLPGEVVADSHVVPIEPEAPAGVCELGVGLYVPESGERLPVVVGGERQPDNVLIVTEIDVQ